MIDSSNHLILIVADKDSVYGDLIYENFIVCNADTIINKYTHVNVFINENGYMKFALNGNIIYDDYFAVVNREPAFVKIGNSENKMWTFYGVISTLHINEKIITNNFNSLAALPLYTFDASKYPTSSGWTANVPYSSMSISSGEFSFTDDGQLQCDSAGSFTLRNAHEFDGDEYIKVVIDGVEYADVGFCKIGNGEIIIPFSDSSNFNGDNAYNLSIVSSEKSDNGGLTYAKGNSIAESILYRSITPLDMTDKCFQYWIYIKNEDVLNVLNEDRLLDTYLYSNADWRNFRTYDLHVGWNLISFDVNRYFSETSEFDISNITTIRLDVNTQNASDVFSVGDIIYDEFKVYHKLSITQGSTLIDADMGTGDVIDGIDIQFREPVE
jgi:hypothetical protein